ncbi:MAG: hypothetical protein CW716_09665 [Candidatus Bathyarchaeum sp.]|nr:MAG: hypothetical protein CW716_09665 [Candidatus Bathyarchaeum sp.]
MRINKILSIIFLLTCLAVTAVSPVLAADDHVGIETEVCGVTVSKYILYSGYNMPVEHHCDVGDYYPGNHISDDMENLELFTQYEWWLRIQICPEETIENVMLYDRFGAEFGVCLVDYTVVDSGEAPQMYTKGKSEKVFLTWNIGTIQGGECATVWLHVWTDHNPAGKQEFTSYGTYYMNSGAVAKWLYDGTKYSAATGQLAVSTIPPPL